MQIVLNVCYILYVLNGLCELSLDQMKKTKFLEWIKQYLLRLSLFKAVEENPKMDREHTVDSLETVASVFNALDQRSL